MVQPDLARVKVNRARTWLDDAESLLARPQDKFMLDVRGRDLATFYLLLAIQGCIDLSAHWLADAGWEVPDEAGGAFDVLADRQAIPRAVADSLRGATGLRNRIVHGYARVEHGRIHAEAPRGIGAMREFLDTVAREAGL